MRVNKSLEQTRAGLRLKRPMNNRSRVFRLPQSALAALEFHRTQQQEHKRLFATDYQDQGLVFCQVNGEFLKPHIVSQVISRRMKKAQIRGASLHSSRHAHASHLLSKGVPLSAVSARLGHSDTNVTARVIAMLCRLTMIGLLTPGKP
jgi:integrase